MLDWIVLEIRSSKNNLFPRLCLRRITHQPLSYKETLKLTKIVEINFQTPCPSQ